MLLSRVTILGLCIVAMPITIASAQIPRLSFDLTLGPSVDANSGRYRQEGVSAVVDLSLGASFGPSDSRSLMFVVSHGTQGKLRTSGDGLLWPDGTCCVPYFPAFTMTSVVGGYQTADKTLRVLGGLTRASETGTSTLGLVARLDGALPLIRPLWAVASLRGIYIPDFNDDRFVLGGLSVGLGLR
jgi:hypothetical protein